MNYNSNITDVAYSYNCLLKRKTVLIIKSLQLTLSWLTLYLACKIIVINTVNEDNQLKMSRSSCSYCLYFFKVILYGNALGKQKCQEGCKYEDWDTCTSLMRYGHWTCWH